MGTWSQLAGILFAIIVLAGMTYVVAWIWRLVRTPDTTWRVVEISNLVSERGVTGTLFRYVYRFGPWTSRKRAAADAARMMGSPGIQHRKDADLYTIGTTVPGQPPPILQVAITEAKTGQALVDHRQFLLATMPDPAA